MTATPGPDRADEAPERTDDAGPRDDPAGPGAPAGESQAQADRSRPLDHGPQTRGLAPIWADTFGRIALRSLQAIIVVTLAAGLVYAGITLKLVVLPVIIALILAAAFAPLTGALKRRRVPAPIAALISLLLGVGLLVGLLTIVGLAVASQLDTLVDSATKGYGQLQTVLSNGSLPIDTKQIQQAQEAATAYLSSGAFDSTALSGLSVVGNLLTGLVLLIFVLFFFLKDGPMIWNFLIRPFDGERRARAERIGHNSIRVLGGYVRGTALVAAIDAVFIGGTSLVAGVSLWPAITVLVFVTAFIPVVGAVVSGVVAVLVALALGGVGPAIAVAIAVVVTQQVEGNVLQPIIMGKTLSLHPLVILLALTAGSLLGGIVGAILSTPTASVLWSAAKAWRGEEVDDRGKTRKAAMSGVEPTA
ncbi:AI-2E family transporter [uncultured Amnibacterium sp.]|uniref:AI-2E family transporter n=1 Tax=uncultured Amnibacterium sp. TaxID=1631851 RepID=UPI0035CA2F3A